MIPSLVAGELKASIVEYLATTFALSDDETYRALTEFLLDKEDGIFRGPFLRVRLPFVDAPEDVDTGLRWTPPGLRPYAHQLQAWQRLAGRDVTPKPTLITTGTGSGKSEGFLIPVIDHCISRRAAGQRGIKALLLYPMNALVTDQERRIAKLLTDPEAVAAGVRAGVWIGNDHSVASRSAMTDSLLITDPGALMNDPPDILLSNYKMLDRLLTTPSRQRLWAANMPLDPRGGWNQPLTYLVLDEFHTYDGAQGTDVAMLLRRLGHRLGIATAQSPLAGVAPVGTSATLGSSIGATGEMLEFARKVFGVAFDATAVIGEQRKTVEEVCPDIDFSLPAPDPATVAALDLDDPVSGRDQLALAFTETGFDDAQDVGDRLLRHPLTAAMLRVAAERPRAWEAAVAAIAQQVPDWGKVYPDQPAEVAAALERFVALISQARGRTGSGAERPLFSVEVQVWIREVTRLLRSVAKQPAFRWSDSPADPDTAVIELPSVYCTECGRAGWMGLANKASGQGSTAMEPVVPDEPAQVYRASISDRARTRALLRADPSEPDVLWFDPDDGRLYALDSEAAMRVPVLVGGMTDGDRNEAGRDEAAKQQRCPSCGRRDAIRFLGSRVTTLASVGITQMFGSSHVADDERKLLAFTDSVQDASHRAAFFSGRTQRFNLRATMSRAVQDRGRLPLTEIADVALARADAEPKPPDALFSLIPADLLWERDLDAAWKQPASSDARKARKALAERLGFDAVLEAGLRSRFGRTLETTNTAIAEVLVRPEEWVRLVAFAVEAVQANTGQMITEADDVRTWIEGLLARLRLRGGIYHPYLDHYLKDHARRWWIWGGGDRFAPKFPRGISAPAFFSSAPSEDLDAIAGSQTWVAQWSKKVLGIEGPGADVAAKDVLDELVKVGVLAERATSKGRVWGLPPGRIAFVDVADDATQTELRCDLCATRHHAPPDQAPEWVGRPCLRLRCPGHYVASAAAKANFYRELYRQGRIRRVVAAEHTGLLTQAQRLSVETGFKDGGRPDAPNVLTSTPTLEMGIDIGDLSAVMLTAVPPTQSSYVQRVGRAGRSTGNAFVTTFAEGDPRSLYFLQDPELMIAGDIAPPNCYLDAIEILRRQYLAFLIDRAAEGPQGPMPAAGEIPRSIRQVAGKGLEAGGWMRIILDQGASPAWVAKFTGLFGANLGEETKARLSQWAGSDMAAHVERALGRWEAGLKVLVNQRDRLRDREKELKDKDSLADEEQESLGRIVAELRAILRRIKDASDAHPLNALEAVGLMPSYTLFDDTVTLEVSLWSVNEQHDPNDESSRRIKSDGGEYARAASRAIRELAPGNSFYVDAHKVKIDAVDNGTEHEPAHSTWRLCPSCAWATSDAASSPATCPRCGAPGIADQGAIVDVLPLRKVFSTEREITARVGDETEERERLFHDVRALVDIDPADISSALLHTGTAFGVETARQATIRYLNLGLSPSRNPRALKIAGAESRSGLFRVCRHCGGVDGVRNRVGDAADLSAHRAWCKVRSGALNEQWDDLALVHELVTEAVRILLPVAEFEHVERTASFKAALMLGLRDSFGGDPAHLRVVESDFPAPGGDPNDRNRLVVLHDTVPGGTGYLTRLADPDRFRDILTRARALITTCECQTRGKPGCHKCLYGGIDRHELPRVSRVVALELLDEILNGWGLEDAPNGTITGINLNPVVQSELERMFKVLLHRWAETTAARVTSRVDPSDPSLRRFDLRFQDGPHWEIREQVDLTALHGTLPDFYATRVDASGTPDVAIFLDGWAYHGADPAHVDGDAAKRVSLRAGGICVWVLTWKDVRASLEAVGDGGGVVGPATPFSGPARNQAAQIVAGLLGGEHPVAGVLKLGAFEQLMDRLRHPEADVWHSIGTGVAAGPVRNTPTVDVADFAATLEAAAGGGDPQPAGMPTEIRAATWHSTGGLVAHTVVQQQPQRCAAVVSLDTSGEVTQDEWSDWLHLGNLLAGLGDDSVITTTRSYNPAAGPESAPEPPVATTDSDVDALLADSYDEAARKLGIAGAGAGFTELVVGFETDWPDGTLIEIAWPASKVGVLPSGAEIPAQRDGWTLLVAGMATDAELLAALKVRGRLMPTLVFAKQFLDDFATLQPPVRQKVRELPDKFENAAVSGVHLEKLNAQEDDRVRTVRVDQFWRGVVVRLGEGRYALLRVLGHDKAIDWAKRQKFGVNPVTGIVEILDVPTVEDHVDALVAAEPAPGVDAGLFDALRDRDFTSVGIDSALVPVLRRLNSEDELLSIASYLPDAQADAVLLLADGKSTDEVWQEIQESYVVKTGEEVDPDDIDTALDRPASRASFVVTTSDDELLKLLSGDFEAWRTFLHATQQTLAYRPIYNGPAKITGGAGTGKTVVLMHRARFLAQRLVESDRPGRVLVATYTTALAKNLSRVLGTFCMPEQQRRLHVTTVDALARQVLAAEKVKLRPVDSDELRDIAEEAAGMSGLDALGVDHRFLIAEWQQVVLAKDINTLPEYAMTPRPGRGRRLSRAERKEMWSAIERFTGELASRHRATWVQIAAMAAEQLTGRDARLYAHAVVDEAQDLHPAQWRLLRACVPVGANDLVIAGDAHQRIYDHRVSLSSIGIETRGRSRRLKINYRTSQSILAVAQGVLRGEKVDDLDGDLEAEVGYRSAFDGPAPEIERFTTPAEEAERVADVLEAWLAAGVSPSAIGVVARTGRLLEPIQGELSRRNIAWSNVNETEPTGVRMSTMHSAKGLEFARLAVIGVNHDALPLPIAVTPEAEDKTQHDFDVLRERCLLYVACTRARDELLVTGSGAPSTLLPG